MNIVLVHGILSSSKIFSYMIKQLENKGFTCFAPNLKPSNGMVSIENLSIKLRDKIDSHFGVEEKFVLIGFSMGGIISRYFLQYLGGVDRVISFFSISSPNSGSYLAYLHPGKGAKQLCPNSNLLKELKSSEEGLKQIGLYSFWTPFDLSIIPSKSSEWSIANNIKFYSLFHPLMLFNKKVVQKIIDCINMECSIG